eukprot:3745839-Amphidinium_carterae.1
MGPQLQRSENVEVLYHDRDNPACLAVLSATEDILRGLDPGVLHHGENVEVLFNESTNPSCFATSVGTDDVLCGMDPIVLHHSETAEVLFNERTNPACFATHVGTEDILRGMDLGVMHQGETVAVTHHGTSSMNMEVLFNEDMKPTILPSAAVGYGGKHDDDSAATKERAGLHPSYISAGPELHDVVILSKSVLLADADANHCMPVAMQDGKLAKNELIADWSVLQECVFSVHPGPSF